MMILEVKIIFINILNHIIKEKTDNVDMRNTFFATGFHNGSNKLELPSVFTPKR